MSLISNIFEERGLDPNHASNFSCLVRDLPIVVHKARKASSLKVTMITLLDGSLSARIFHLQHLAKNLGLSLQFLLDLEQLYCNPIWVAHQSWRIKNKKTFANQSKNDETKSVREHEIGADLKKKTNRTNWRRKLRHQHRTTWEILSAYIPYECLQLWVFPFYTMFCKSTVGLIKKHFYYKNSQNR